ncbi:MAG: anhydro-N-acetylmuramic acid kinase, partial [Moraxellaceae bacterium]
MSLYIGLMSGTSVDAVDAVLVDFANPTPELLNTYSCPIPTDLRAELLELFTPGDNEIDRMGAAHRRLGYLYVQAVKQLLQQANISPQQVRAIGNHGQTIRHRPRLEAQCAFTLQIGDNHFLAQSCGICVVGDLRSRDMCVGGQGAPLVPGFHQAVFSSGSVHRSVLNIGGIANVTYLPMTGACQGFDTGPGNGLLDAWISHQKQVPFDQDGLWAASGTVNTELLTLLMAHPFLAMPPPKS